MGLTKGLFTRRGQGVGKPVGTVQQQLQAIPILGGWHRRYQLLESRKKSHREEATLKRSGNSAKRTASSRHLNLTFLPSSHQGSPLSKLTRSRKVKAPRRLPVNSGSLALTRAESEPSGANKVPGMKTLCEKGHRTFLKNPPKFNNNNAGSHVPRMETSVF